MLKDLIMKHSNQAAVSRLGQLADAEFQLAQYGVRSRRKSCRRTAQMKQIGRAQDHETLMACDMGISHKLLTRAARREHKAQSERAKAKNMRKRNPNKNRKSKNRDKKKSKE